MCIYSERKWDADERRQTRRMANYLLSYAFVGVPFWET